MKQILETVILGNYTVKDLLIAAGIAVILFAFIRILIRVFRKKDTGKHFQLVECSNCGWNGKVSRHAGRCPKCNQPLGDQTIKRRG